MGGSITGRGRLRKNEVLQKRINTNVFFQVAKPFRIELAGGLYHSIFTPLGMSTK